MADEYNFDNNEPLEGREPKYKFPLISPITPNALINRFGSAFIYSQTFRQDTEPDDFSDSPLYPSNFDEGTIIFEWDTQGFETERLFVKLSFIGVSRAKNITRTNINGRSGSIKEYYSSSDYEITITGTLFNNTEDLVPEKQLRALSDLYEWNKTVGVVSNFLNRLGVDSIVIENIQMNQSQILNEQEFVFTAYSDYIKKQTGL